MGNKGGKGGIPGSVDQQLEASRRAELLHFKILCLGPGESGKTTVIKQLSLIYNGNLPPKELQLFATVLKDNTLQCMDRLVIAAEKFGYDLGDAAAAGQRVKEAMEECNDDPELNFFSKSLADDIVLLWNHPAIKQAYERRAEFWLLDGANYYFSRVEDFVDPDFVPTEDDVIMARARTTGIMLTEFDEADVHWTVVDVGGQRSERKKWINCFDDVRAVLFVVNLSGYNSVLFEDQTRNRMDEALDLFQEVAGMDIFKETPIYLFLNKKDLFEEQLRRKPLGVAFPDYKGSDDVKECIEYIEFKFVERLRLASKENGRTKGARIWPIAARYKKDVRYAFLEVKEDLVSKYSKEVKKAKKKKAAAGAP